MFAMKIIEKQLVETIHQSLAAEITILRSCRNEHLLRLVDMFESKSKLYIITELAEGTLLKHVAATDGHYSEAVAQSLFAQTCCGVAYLHRRGIVHRDIKPDNILVSNVSGQLRVMLADFGLAAIIARGTLIKGCQGTPSFLAPEIINEKEYGLPIDIWALGVTLFLLLSGQAPFKGQTVTQVLDRVRIGSFSFADLIWANISSEAKDLITRMLAMDPAQRPTIEEVLADPWLTTPPPDLHIPAVRHHLGEYNARRKVMAGVNVARAVHRMGTLLKSSSSIKST